jgi:hypothetical protein
VNSWAGGQIGFDHSDVLHFSQLDWDSVALSAALSVSSPSAHKGLKSKKISKTRIRPPSKLTLPALLLIVNRKSQTANRSTMLSTQPQPLAPLAQAVDSPPFPSAPPPTRSWWQLGPLCFSTQQLPAPIEPRPQPDFAETNEVLFSFLNF